MDIKIGDRITVVRSPYSDIRNGTIATVINIKYNHRGLNLHLYILDLPDHRLFWKWELLKVE